MSFHDHFKLCLFPVFHDLQYSLQIQNFFKLPSGLLIGCRKKVKFPGIFRDRFAEKLADFAGILQKFSRLVSLKNGW